MRIVRHRIHRYSRLRTPQVFHLHTPAQTRPVAKVRKEPKRPVAPPVLLQKRERMRESDSRCTPYSFVKSDQGQVLTTAPPLIIAASDCRDETTSACDSSWELRTRRDDHENPRDAQAHLPYTSSNADGKCSPSGCCRTPFRRTSVRRS